METREILDSLYAIRAGLSVIANNIDSFYNLKLQWLKEIYSIADDPALDYWTKFELIITAPAKVKILPSEAEIKAMPYNSRWCIGASFFDIMSPREESYYFTGRKKYTEFAKSNDFSRIINFEDLKERCRPLLFEKKMEEYTNSKNKPVWDDGRKVTYAEYSDNVNDMMDTIIAEYMRSIFPESRVWYNRNRHWYDDTCSILQKILPDFCTFAHWLNTDDCKKYLDERENYYFSQKKGLISKKIKYPAYLKIVQDAKAKIFELGEKVKTADKTYNETTEWIMPMCKKIYHALVANYSVMLDLRDWKYLDLVIFAIETHRAGNIKEALSYVDDEVRTKRITSTIEKAAKQICDTISMSMAALQNTMVECCNSINARITAVGGELSAKMDRAISATEMSNALLAKANMSSERLLNQVTSIKEIIQ